MGGTAGRPTLVFCVEIRQFIFACDDNSVERSALWNLHIAENGIVLIECNVAGAIFVIDWRYYNRLKLKIGKSVCNFSQTLYYIGSNLSMTPCRVSYPNVWKFTMRLSISTLSTVCLVEKYFVKHKFWFNLISHIFLKVLSLVAWDGNSPTQVVLEQHDLQHLHQHDPSST